MDSGKILDALGILKRWKSHDIAGRESRRYRSDFIGQKRRYRLLSWGKDRNIARVATLIDADPSGILYVRLTLSPPLNLYITS